MPALLSLVAGARPNFMKIAPVIRALRACTDSLDFRLVHTGQHYDAEMSDVFFSDLGIPTPHHALGCGGGTHAEQTARIMVAYEQLCLAERPDMVVVVGDVNSTLACSIVAKKLCIPVAHIEAGLRSGDMTMPEEVNRVVTDALSDLYFVTEPSGEENLLAEGRKQDRIHFVGHVMIDNLLYEQGRLGPPSAEIAALKARLGSHYGVVTLHRPANVDSPPTLTRILGALAEIAASLPLLFPVHPRTRAAIERAGVVMPDGFVVTPPLGYRDFLALWPRASVVLTDSGGLQEETTALGVPCVTLRENTERPVTLTEGTNVLVGSDPARILDACHAALDGGGQRESQRRPALWDGRAAERIVDILRRHFS
jgi:UDP-N-acetylglucosamine 2-epimerase (non-hydrolysing)